MAEGSSSLASYVGNDVVDLAHPACRVRDSGDRLLAKILAPMEREWIEAGLPELRGPRLWALWAAKETAFKVAGKGPDPLPYFRPSEFACELTAAFEPGGGNGEPTLRVRFRGSVSGPTLTEPVRIEGRTNGGYLHMVGWRPGEVGPPGPRIEIGVERIGPEDEGARGFDHLRGAFTAEEWEGVHSLASARVRLLVRERLAQIVLSRGGPPDARGEDGHPPQIEILTSADRPGRTPPRVRVGGIERTDLDLSLSHHGRYLAWAILLPSGG